MKDYLEIMLELNKLGFFHTQTYRKQVEIHIDAAQKQFETANKNVWSSEDFANLHGYIRGMKNALLILKHHHEDEWENDGGE